MNTQPKNDKGGAGDEEQASSADVKVAGKEDSQREVAADAKSAAAEECSGDATGDAGEELTLEEALEKLAEAEQAAARAGDDLLRLRAEMQNLRRRTEQDIEKAHKYGQERFSLELLTVKDNLERSLGAADEHEDETIRAIREGVDLTLKSFSDCFRKFHIEAVDPEGEPFDPRLHQAMSVVENPDVEPNTVVTVMQKGYTLHDRVIRPAMVIVSKDSPAGAGNGNGKRESEDDSGAAGSKEDDAG